MSQLAHDIAEITKKVINSNGIGKVIGGFVTQGGDDPVIAIGNQNMELPSRAVIIPDSFKKVTYPVELTGEIETEDGTQPVTVSGEVEIDNSLQAEDRVYLLKMDNGRKFFVIGRGVVYTTEPQEEEDDTN